VGSLSCHREKTDHEAKKPLQDILDGPLEKKGSRGVSRRLGSFEDGRILAFAPYRRIPLIRVVVGDAEAEPG
jgi:hypothetical protein